ncbi:hypothetical protein DU500_17730 (plasmid) [Haloplanus rubicundus]|uniref:Halobacterial output domain-containing protein n=1 Tax=Haloplanus rubicundus TaxID=1547898 RepID=A0A345E7Z4_9EURY|nr:HalOD1 output domain-containing protein [Haloplanus rubicundus]AXG08316.1 hypothetical protein DU500_17730 [Haloplanus rubicundus]
MDEDDRGGADVRPAVTTEEAFREALRQLVIEADSNGVDVRGGWPVERTDAERAWEFENTEVSRRSTATTEDSEFPACAVVDAVAEREGVDATDLPPLYDSIGPDVLEIVTQSNDESGRTVTFEYYSYTITLDADGTIVIDE